MPPQFAFNNTHCNRQRSRNHPQDQGVSVRKRAVRALWECCARCPGFSRRVDAVVTILQRVGDAEDSMRALVTKLCGDMWFAPGAGDDEVRWVPLMPACCVLPGLSIAPAAAAAVRLSCGTPFCSLHFPLAACSRDLCSCSWKLVQHMC